VLVVDDDGFSAEALADMLEDEGFAVVDVAIDEQQTLDATRRLTPDLVVMDLRMPVMDGIEATRRIVAEALPSQVLMLSAFDEDILRAEATRSGACGYLVKGCRPQALFSAMRDALTRRQARAARRAAMTA